MIRVPGKIKFEINSVRLWSMNGELEKICNKLKRIL